MLFSSGHPSHVADPPAVMLKGADHVPEAEDVHPYGDVVRCRIGDWATYRVGDRTITLCAAAKEPAGVWFEVADEEARTVSARLLTEEGHVLRAWFRILPGPEVHRQKRVASSRPPSPGEHRVEEEIRTDRTTVDGREIGIRIVSATLEDLDGRRRREETAWSAEVPPLFAGSVHGGLVRRPGVELLRWGTGGTRAVIPPEEP